jgi:peptidoglycan/LPS O-acetylase OafA/YrhL
MPRFSQRILATLSRETSSGRFIPEMDGLRFVAISLVVLFHLSGYLIVKSPVTYGTPPDADWLARVANEGRRGVELFFVISGFILGKYYLRRLTRLEPPYIVTLLVFFLLQPFIDGKALAGQFPHLIASVFYLHNLTYSHISTVLGVAWSLEIEVQFYILVPVLTLLFTVRDRGRRRATLLGTMVLILVAQSVFLPDGVRGHLSILAYLQFFVAGFVLADIYITDWREAPALSWWWDGVALLGWPALYLILRTTALRHWVFPFAILLLFCAAFRGRITNFLTTRPWITAIGGMCYTMYLIHYPVISVVGRVTRRWATGQAFWVDLLIQLAVVGTVIVLVTAAYFVVLEKPCMRRDWPRRLRERLFA